MLITFAVNMAFKNQFSLSGINARVGILSNTFHKHKREDFLSSSNAKKSLE